MAAIVGIDAKIDYSDDGGTSWETFPQRNTFSISISVDTAEYKPFVATLADAWVTSARTWMNWSGSMDGYFDDADNSIFDTMVAGTSIDFRFYVSRAATSAWQGTAILTNVNHEVTAEDYASLSVDFSGQGALTFGTIS